MRAELYERVPAVPRPVWAVQWLADQDSWKAINDLGAVFVCPKELLQLKGSEDAQLLAGVDGAQGMVVVPVGHWVVKAGVNDYYPVDPEYFADNYQRKFSS